MRIVYTDMNGEVHRVRTPNGEVVEVETEVGTTRVGFVEPLRVQIVAVNEVGLEDRTNFRRNGKQVTAK